MGKASSAKKVARAARAGSSSRSGERRHLGFSALVALIVVLGIGTVVLARVTRDAVARPTLTDHWHATYAVYDCTDEAILPAFTSDYDPEGIHSHADGLIHIHPFGASATGEHAKLALFFAAMGVEVTDESMTLPESGGLLENGAECGGEEAVLRLLYWPSTGALEAGDEPTVITSDFASRRLERNGEIFLFFFAPEGAEIPEFPAERLEALEGAGGVDDPVVANTTPPLDTGTVEVTEEPTEDTTEAPTEGATEAATEEATEAATEAPTEAPTETATEAATDG